MKFIQNLPKKTIFLFLFSTTILFLGFLNNFWQVVDKDWFETSMKDGDGRVIARLVKSRRDGLFSAGGLIGTIYINSISEIDGKRYPFAYQVFVEDKPFDQYVTYDSQIGGQGIFLSILDKSIPLPPYKRLRIYTVFFSLVNALAVTAIILWFYGEFGLFTGLFVLITALFSRWLVGYGNKLWWQLWAFYLPMIVLMAYLKRFGLPSKLEYFRFGICIFVAVFIKCLFNGYEFITTTLVMMVVPFTYYSFIEKTRLRLFLNRSLVITVSSILAILLSLFILCIQIASVEGSVQKGIDHIVFSLGKRTYANAEDFPQQDPAMFESKTLDVVVTYLNNAYYYINPVPTDGSTSQRVGVRYWQLIILFAAISIILGLFRKRIKFRGINILPLIWATWFSILAPLSWFFIFKSHSYVHTFLDPIVWQMPFTLFGFSLCGFGIKGLFSK